jgi:hypothetical protein
MADEKRFANMTDLTHPGLPSNVSTVSASAGARLAAEAAGRAAIAVAVAAEQANVKGPQTSEFKVTLGAMIFAGVVGALKALALIPGPWQIAAALGLGAVGSAAAYSNSRGKVKAAALTAAATTGSGPVSLPPGY